VGQDGPVNMSTVEGVCGRLKFQWNKANNPKTRDEVLRAMVVFTSTSLVARRELWNPGFRKWCVKAVSEVEGGGIRNEREAVARLGELEEGHLKRKQTRSRKHTIKVRRRDTPLLTGKRKLEALDTPGCTTSVTSAL
jgi:hypothetical protein